MCTNLTGLTHSEFFSDMMVKIGGIPAHVSVDKAKAWLGVEKQLSCVFGDTSAATVLNINDEVRDCDIIKCERSLTCLSILDDRCQGF